MAQYPQDVCRCGWQTWTRRTGADPGGLQRLVELGVLGYDFPPKNYARRWQPHANAVQLQVSRMRWLPRRRGCRVYHCCAHALYAGQGILVQPPVYPPFLKVHGNAGLVRQDARWRRRRAVPPTICSGFCCFPAGSPLRRANTGMFLLCNPQSDGQVIAR